MILYALPKSRSLASTACSIISGFNNIPALWPKVVSSTRTLGCTYESKLLTWQEIVPFSCARLIKLTSKKGLYNSGNNVKTEIFMKKYYALTAFLTGAFFAAAGFSAVTLATFSAFG